MSNSSNSEGPSLGSKIIAFIYNIYKTIKRFVSPNNQTSSIQHALADNQTMDSEAKTILSNSIKFIDKTAEDVMIPRSDIFAVQDNATIEVINEALLASSHTRLLVYKENLDNIVGFIHIKDLYKYLLLQKKFNIADIVRQPIIAVASTKLTHLLSMMQQERKHLAVVADEYGGTEGIVTNEDVMEALVGEINDEHDENKTSKKEYHLASPNILISNARLRIEKVEELLHINLKNYHEDCDTIGGIVMAKSGQMPAVGSAMHIEDNILVEVLEAEKRVLKKLKITVLS